MSVSVNGRVHVVSHFGHDLMLSSAPQDFAMRHDMVLSSDPAPPRKEHSRCAALLAFDVKKVFLTPTGGSTSDGDDVGKTFDTKDSKLNTGKRQKISSKSAPDEEHESQEPKVHLQRATLRIASFKTSFGSRSKYSWERHFWFTRVENSMWPFPPIFRLISTVRIFVSDICGWKIRWRPTKHYSWRHFTNEPCLHISPSAWYSFLPTRVASMLPCSEFLVGVWIGTGVLSLSASSSCKESYIPPCFPVLFCR